MSTQKSDTSYSVRSYITGFLLSVYLTIVAYLLVSRHVFTGRILISLIIGLALVQFAVQAWYFLHLGQERNPRWKQITFVFMMGTVLILVVGSLWIMANLDYHHSTTPSETDTMIIEDEGITPH